MVRAAPQHRDAMADPRRLDLARQGAVQWFGAEQSAWTWLWPLIGRSIAAVVATTSLAADVAAQGLPPPVTRVSMDDAVRLTIERNQTLRGQRLTIDASIADQTTAALKPNPSLSFGADGFTPFSPRQMTWDFLDNERQLQHRVELHVRARRQAREAHDGGRGHDRRHAQERDRSRAAAALPGGAGVRRRPARQVDAGARAAGSQELLRGRRDQSPAGGGRRPGQGDFYKISLQKLQFEQDVSAAQVGLIQAKASLRQLMGFESHRRRLRDRRRSRVRAAYAGPRGSQAAGAREPPRRPGRAAPACTLARDTVALEHGNRARDRRRRRRPTRTSGPDNTVGVGVVDQSAHSRSQPGQHRAQPDRGPPGRRGRSRRPGSRPSPTS